MGSYYTAVFHLDDGTTSREYWVVPVSQSPVTVSSIESTRAAGQRGDADGDEELCRHGDCGGDGGTSAGFDSPYVLKAGDTMTGALVLPGDPVSAQQAADKHYVDTNVTAVQTAICEQYGGDCGSGDGGESTGRGVRRGGGGGGGADEPECDQLQ